MLLANLWIKDFVPKNKKINMTDKSTKSHKLEEIISISTKVNYIIKFMLEKKMGVHQARFLVEKTHNQFYKIIK